MIKKRIIYLPILKNVILIEKLRVKHFFLIVVVFIQVISFKTFHRIVCFF